MHLAIRAEPFSRYSLDGCESVPLVHFCGTSEPSTWHEPWTWKHLKTALEEHGVADDTIIESITITGDSHQMHVEVTEHDEGPQSFTVEGRPWPSGGMSDAG
jgi:hypothetical protein